MFEPPASFLEAPKKKNKPTEYPNSHDMMGRFLRTGFVRMRHVTNSSNFDPMRKHHPWNQLERQTNCCWPPVAPFFAPWVLHRNRTASVSRWKPTDNQPGDSKRPFDPLVGGRLTFPKGHSTIKKRWQRIAVKIPGFLLGKKTLSLMMFNAILTL